MNSIQTARPSAADITKNASLQSYYTIKFLVDRPLVQDAFCAYAYFRWVDDCLDDGGWTTAERLDFIRRQQDLVERCYKGKPVLGLCPQEEMIAGLIGPGLDHAGGLCAYIQHMMAVMAFDAERRGRRTSQAELAAYTRHLACAVTEALHHFIGHGCRAPQCEARYQAVAGAHIAHMLRDTFADLESGYFNIPNEVLESQGIAPEDVAHDAYRAWVKYRVRLARSCFEAGKGYLAQVESLRCRLAGYGYIARFEWLLDAIEADGCLIRPAYSERKSLGVGLKMALGALTMATSSRGSTSGVYASGGHARSRKDGGRRTAATKGGRL